MTTTREETIARLHKIADWLPMLGQGRGQGSGDGIRVMPGSRVLIDTEALSLPGDISGTLGSWVRICHEDGLVDDPGDWPGDFPVSICLWLARHADRLQGHEAADEFNREVKALHSRVRISAGIKPELVLHCLVEGCRGAITPLTVDDGKLLADACENGHRIDRHEAIRRALRLQDMPLTELAEHVGVPPRTLYRWRERNLIQPIRRRNGVELFNFEAVHLVAERLRAAG